MSSIFQTLCDFFGLSGVPADFAVLPPEVGAYDDKGVAGLFGAPAEVPFSAG